MLVGKELTGAMTRAQLPISSGTTAGVQEEQRTGRLREVLVAKREAHVAETLELAMAMVVV